MSSPALDARQTLEDILVQAAGAVRAGLATVPDTDDEEPTGVNEVLGLDELLAEYVDETQDLVTTRRLTRDQLHLQSMSDVSDCPSEKTPIFDARRFCLSDAADSRPKLPSPRARASVAATSSVPSPRRGKEAGVPAAANSARKRSIVRDSVLLGTLIVCAFAVAAVALTPQGYDAWVHLRESVLELVARVS